MSKLKRGLASALAALLLSAMLPVGALAADEEPGSIPADEVIFNTGNMEITVGSDPDKETELPYTTFDEEGNYTIELPEEDPFFPYEVQFQYDGETTEEWFETEDDTVEIGGHTFSVSVENGESQRLGFYVGDEYIPARPKAKEFENDPDAGISTASLLPLDSLDLESVDLTRFLPLELERVKVSYLFGETEVEASQIAWKLCYYYDDDIGDKYEITDTGGEIDLSGIPLRSSVTGSEIELIVGTADPLNPENKRCRIQLVLPNVSDILKFGACDEEGSTINIYSNSYNSYDDLHYYRVSVDPNDWSEGNAYLNMTFGENGFLTGLQDKNVTVYAGYYESMDEIERANPADITNRVWNRSGRDGYLGNYEWKNKNTPKFTVVFRRNGAVAMVHPFYVRMNISAVSLNASYLYQEVASEETVSRERVSYGNIDPEDVFDRVYRMSSEETPDNGMYFINLNYNHPDPKEDDRGTGINMIKAAYVGDFKTAKDIPADAEDIKNKLFTSAANKGGYQADFSKGASFTVIDIYDEIYHYSVKTLPYQAPPEEPDPVYTPPKDNKPLERDPYFQIKGIYAEEEDGNFEEYVIAPEDDSYYANGYQTVFLLEGYNNTVTEENIRPVYTVYPHETPSVAGADDAPVRIYASHDDYTSDRQFSGQNVVPFQPGKAIPYSATTKEKNKLKNYWVTFVTRHEGGAKLFVNAVTNSEDRDKETNLPIRDIFLDDLHDNRHDIFVANIGDEELTDLSVTLEDAQNVQLDEYWRFGGENQVNKLAPFTDFGKNTENGNWDYNAELKNATKIRLIPTETNGLISGKLTITAKAGSETVKETVVLSGKARVPQITEKELRPAVKYVPYATLIQTNNMYDTDAIRFEFVSGQLPGGMTIYPNGELYGAPLATGTFTFTVRATYKNDPAASDEKEFTLEVKENTNLNVWNETDDRYDIDDPVGEIKNDNKDESGNMSTDQRDYILEEYIDQIFLSKGPYDEFVLFWIDGKVQRLGTDYFAEEGSTKITILKQTLERAGKGPHTIAAEFRDGGSERSGTLKTAAQNYRINVDPPKSNNDTNGGGGHATRPGGSSGNTSTPPKKSGTPSKSEPEMAFDDVQLSDWFYDDVFWAYQQKLMVGMSSSLFGSKESISQATIVTTLARLADIDLSRFENETEPDVEAGQWFTAAAIWAKRSGLLPDRSRFTGNEDISRGQMAVMLAKYLRSVGLGEPENAQPVQFADAAQMTDEEAVAFRVLYARGVFYGVGGNRMEPAGTTTRSQFAALLNRISDVLDER